MVAEEREQHDAEVGVVAEERKEELKVKKQRPTMKWGKNKVHC